MIKNKLLTSTILVIVLIVSLSMPTFASGSYVEQQVISANNQINQLIDQAKIKANQFTIDYQNKVNAERAILTRDKSMAVVVSQRIQNYTNEYHNRLDDLGNNLICDAYNKVLDLYNATSRSKVVFDCEYIPVNLGDRIYMVDPLRFVGW